MDKKTIAGIVLIAGLFLIAASCFVGGFLTLAAGCTMFFFGSMVFSRG